MIECRALARSFDTDRGPKVALDTIDFEVERGETRCLLGPNGAGKTTLVRVLSTILLPTSGTAKVAGLDVVEDAQAVRRAIRLSLGGDRGFHWGLSVFENVRFWATMYGLGWRESTKEANRVLERVGMTDQKWAKADDLSRGMKQRVHLARALLGAGQLLLLDEPTTGMDPVAARSFRDLIRELQAEGRTILLTTHNMVEAEDLAHRITMLNDGRVEATDTSSRLRKLFAERATIATTELPDAVRREISALDGVVSIHDERDQVLIDVDGDTRLVLQALIAAGVVHLRAEPPSLEQVYLQLFGDRGMSV